MTCAATRSRIAYPKPKRKDRRIRLPGEGMDFPQHLQWIRTHRCCVDNAECDGTVQAAHVRNSFLTPEHEKGGSALKPHDKWTIPLCRHHHDLQTRKGEAWFERTYGIDMGASAQVFAAQSPHRKRWEPEE